MFTRSSLAVVPRHIVSNYSVRRLFSTSNTQITHPNYKHPVPDTAKFSKLTNEGILHDKFGRFHNYLRISLTEHCNFNCLYCVYDQDIQYTPKPELLTQEEMLKLTNLFISAGVTKIRLTGGEPTIFKGLPKFISEIGPKVKQLGITTNGFMLYKHLEEYKKNGLNLLNISLDSFNTEKAEKIARTKGHKHVMRSVYKAIDLGYSPLKINCVVMRGINDDELLDFVEFTRDRDVNVRFIEFFSIAENGWSANKMVPYKEMVSRIEAKYGPLKFDELKFGDTARNCKIDGFKGTVSFITSSSNPFCAKCNRIRLLSSGLFRRCLHDDRMFDLKDLLRKGASDDAILESISSFMKKKEHGLAGMHNISKLQKNGLEMIKIGG